MKNFTVYYTSPEGVLNHDEIEAVDFPAACSQAQVLAWHKNASPVAVLETEFLEASFTPMPFVV